MSTPTVKAIDRRSVHQICSGQVVVTLSTAMKELVENSLDAGATNIEIRLKNWGADCIEVVDNGSGVLPENFQALVLKHHTSKLNVFSDLVGVETFGFRGEALSSLCALSDLFITTCHHSKSIGARIEYDHDGKVTKQVPAARVPGTTVTLHNLFATLPVRRMEFLRNLKREHAKLVQVLQSYCVIATGVRFSCCTQTEKGKKNMVLSTNGNAEMKDNISNVFGPKQLQTLLGFQQVSPMQEDCEEQGLDMARASVDESPVFRLTGFVSRCDHGAGRSASDRQCIFINKRPCDLPKVIRLVNEVYHAFNRNQYPFLALNISLNKELVDVNVTPDKRQVFLQQEKLLLATIKSSLKVMFDPGTSSYELNEKPLGHFKLGKAKNDVDTTEFSKSIKDRLLLANTSNTIRKEKRFGSILDYARTKQRNRNVELDMDCSNNDYSSSMSNNNNTAVNDDKNTANDDDNDKNIVNNNITATTTTTIPHHNSNNNNTTNDDDDNNNTSTTNTNNNNDNSKNNNSNDQFGLQQILPDSCVTKQNVNGENPKTSSREETLPSAVIQTLETKETDLQCGTANGVSESRGSLEIIASELVKRNTDTMKRKLQADCEGSSEESAGRCMSKKMRLDDESVTEVDVTNRKTVTVEFDCQKLRSMDNREKCQQQRNMQARSFCAAITPESNQNAEDELQRHITKDMFSEMEIIGQFNQGFIISKLKDDLFIIDQHASDEKHNFEEQKKNTVLKSQRLICPQTLDLTAVNESILMENIDVFKKNGFDFEIDEEAPVSQRVKLLSQPVSRNWSFDKSDIDELIFMLSDSPGVSCRPSNVRKMFASRACRMSIMVGTALTKAQMRRVVGHMGKMEHPWNCPHGRPTMRHLINLNMVRK